MALSFLHSSLWVHSHRDALFYVIVHLEALVVKNLPLNTGDARDVGLILGSGRTHGEGMVTTPVFLSGKFHGQKILAGHSYGSQRVGHEWTLTHKTLLPKEEKKCSSALSNSNTQQKPLLKMFIQNVIDCTACPFKDSSSLFPLTWLPS